MFDYLTKLDRSVVFGSNTYRSKSTNHSNPRTKTITRAYSENRDAFFSDEEFSKQIQELAMKFQDTRNSTATDSESEKSLDSDSVADVTGSNGKIKFLPFEPLQPPEWSGREETITIPASIEWKANSFDIPLSLRIIKRKKKQLQLGFTEAGDSNSASSSVKKAFSSMVFIIRELQSFTLQMRENLLYEDLQGTLERVQTEMHASFVWLFQQVFSHTPTLMISVMILLANYTVYSMANATAFAAAPPAALMESVSDQTQSREKFDSSAIKTFSVDGRTAGDGRFDRAASATENGLSTEDEEEVRAWNAVVEEAARMQGEVRDVSLDEETVQRFVSPVTVEIEGDSDYMEYFKTELVYRTSLAEDPENCVLLANYAQFLYLVAHDYDR